LIGTKRIDGRVARNRRRIGRIVLLRASWLWQVGGISRVLCKLELAPRCAVARLHANKARWKTARTQEPLLGHACGSPRRLQHHAVNLEYRLRNIETDCDNLAHGRLPS
jgi:hypothetical protein